MEILGLLVLGFGLFALVRVLRVAVHAARGVRGARVIGAERDSFAVPATARLALAAAAFGSTCALIFVLGTGATLLAPGTRPTTMVKVLRGRAAERAGIRDGDRVVRVDGKTIGEFDDIPKALAPRAGEAIPIDVDRGGTNVTVMVTPGAAGTPDAGKIGIQGVPAPISLDPVAAVVAGLKFPGMLYGMLFDALTGRVRAEFVGPIAFVTAASSAPSISASVAVVLYLIAVYLCWMLPFVAPFAAWSASRRPGRG